MRISHKYKFLWISRTKTGSTSIREILDPYSDIKGGKKRPFQYHATYPELAAAFDDRGWEIDDFHIFMCERNPWKRVPSIWKYSKVNSLHQKFWQPGYSSKERLLEFDEFIRSEKGWGYLERNHTLEKYIGSRNIPDNMRIYDIDSQQQVLLKDLSEVIGEEMKPIPKRNTSKYSEEDLRSISETFKDEGINKRMRDVFDMSIELFSYQKPHE